MSNKRNWPSEASPDGGQGAKQSQFGPGQLMRQVLEGRRDMVNQPNGRVGKNKPNWPRYTGRRSRAGTPNPRSGRGQALRRATYRCRYGCGGRPGGIARNEPNLPADNAFPTIPLFYPLQSRLCKTNPIGAGAKERQVPGATEIKNDSAWNGPGKTKPISAEVSGWKWRVSREHGQAASRPGLRTSNLTLGIAAEPGCAKQGPGVR